MARMRVEGLDDLMLSMKQVAELPWEVGNEMLQAGGKVVASAQKKKYKAMLYNPSNTGKHVADSIVVQPKMRSLKDGTGHYVTVYPYGTHHMYHRRVKTKTYKNSKSGRKYTVGGDVKPATMNDVAFVHEYGAPKRGISAKGIMRAANAESTDAAVAAEREVYDAWLKKNNL